MIGIYKIRNIKTNDYYIGSSINIKRRWYRHLSLLRKNNHHSIILQNAYNKYGEESFEFIILEKCNKKELLEKEQYYLDNDLPKYNICSEAYATRGRKHTEETKRKISESNKGKHHFVMTQKQKDKLSKIMTGRKNPEHSKRMKGNIPWNKGKKTGSLSEEHKQKIAVSLKGNKNAKRK